MLHGDVFGPLRDIFEVLRTHFGLPDAAGLLFVFTDLFCVGSVRSNTTIIKFPNLLFYVVFLFATRIHALLDLDGLNFKINISLFIVTNKVQRNALECCINV